MNEAEFLKWSQTTEGRTALEGGVLGPRTLETKDIGAHVPYPGQPIPEKKDVPDSLNNMCLKAKKKCKHLHWQQMRNEDNLHNLKNLKEEFARLSRKEEEIIEDAETREATKDYYAHNTVTVLF